MENSEIDQPSTECAAPPPLSDDELLMALDGEATPQIQAHLQKCAFCSARKESMRMFEESLHTAMYRADCPPSDQLADYTMGLLKTSDRNQVERHLEECPLCREEVQSLRAIFGTEEELQPANEPAQAPVWEQVKGMFQSLEEQIVRVLMPQPLVAAGVRKGKKGSDDARILSYGTDEVSVMLSLEKVVEGLKVNGEILNVEEQDVWGEGYVELISLAEGQRRFLAQVDEDEMFTFEAVPPGQFNLNIYAVNGQILRLQAVELAL